MKTTLTPAQKKIAAAITAGSKLIYLKCYGRQAGYHLINPNGTQKRLNDNLHMQPVIDATGIEVEVHDTRHRANAEPHVNMWGEVEEVGTCQLCGKNRSLTAGKMPRHGACKGGGHPPIEKSRELADKAVAYYTSSGRTWGVSELQARIKRFYPDAV